MCLKKPSTNYLHAHQRLGLCRAKLDTTSMSDKVHWLLGLYSKQVIYSTAAATLLCTKECLDCSN